MRSVALWITTLFAFAQLSLVVAQPSGNDARPNIVLIMTDDQDARLGSMDFMPLVRKHITNQGTMFRKHYCTIAICCPSRVSLLTGQAAHNTNVTHVFPPYGGYPKFVQRGYNQNYLPIWLQEGAYNTYYVGKFLNGHDTENWNNPFPAGWNGTEFLLDPWTYDYLNATFQRNQDEPRNFMGQYSNDLVEKMSLDFIDDAAAENSPFFITVAPIGPHSQVLGLDTLSQPPGAYPIETAPIPAKRHENLFPGVKTPRGYNFNPDMSTDVAWLKLMDKLNDTAVEAGDDWHRKRLQSLQSIDEMVEKIILKLDNHNILENTYVIYTTDNGFHIGQHRLLPGKSCGFEEDINIPFVLRGPGVPKRHVVDVVSTHTDVAPTVLQMAGIKARPDFDGAPMPLTAAEMIGVGTEGPREHVNVEYWGVSLEGKTKLQNGTIVPGGPSTYKALRVIGDDYSVYYSVWCTNEREIYDMIRDPGQMYNLQTSGQEQYLHRPLSHVRDRLDALLMVLKSCKGDTCRRPWAVLHPHGEVTNLREALDSRWDCFYSKQPKIDFNSCRFGQNLAEEGPMDVIAWDP